MTGCKRFPWLHLVAHCSAPGTCSRALSHQHLSRSPPTLVEGGPDPLRGHSQGICGIVLDSVRVSAGMPQESLTGIGVAGGFGQPETAADARTSATES